MTDKWSILWPILNTENALYLLGRLSKVWNLLITNSWVNRNAQFNPFYGVFFSDMLLTWAFKHEAHKHFQQNMEVCNVKSKLWWLKRVKRLQESARLNKTRLFLYKVLFFFDRMQQSIFICFHHRLKVKSRREESFLIGCFRLFCFCSFLSAHDWIHISLKGIIDRK